LKIAQRYAVIYRDSIMTTPTGRPEDRARSNIDRLLTDSGWIIQNRNGINIEAGRGIAIREFLLAPGYGFADYLLYVDGNLNLGIVGSIEIWLPPESQVAQITSELNRQLSVVAFIRSTIPINLARALRIQQAILNKAFAGELVPQDPNDEPASALLERIGGTRTTRRRRTRAIG
jgi:hypothetical protein